MSYDCLLSPLAGLLLPGHDINFKNSIDDLVMRLERAAEIFLELLHESKMKLVDTPLSAISLICEVAHFMQKERESDSRLFRNYYDTQDQASQTRLVFQDSKDEASQTRLAFQDIEILYSKAQVVRSVHREIQKVEEFQSCENGHTKNCLIADEEDENNYSDGNHNDDKACHPADDYQEHQCRYCKKVFIDKKNLKAHLWVHEREKLFECPFCGKKFLRSHQLTRHKRIHTGDKPYKCTMCSKSFSDVSNLHAHKRKAHPEEALLNQCNDQKGNDKFETQTNSNIPSEEMTQSELRNNNKTHSNSPKTRGKVKKETVNCKPQQKKQPSKKSELIKHPEKHKQTVQEYQKDTDDCICKICGKSLNNRSAMMRHMKRHMSLESYICEFCNKEFDDMAEMRAHIQSHTGDRPYTCSVCSKSFRSQSTLRGHMSLHNDKRPYSCQICGKSFVQTSGLNAHKLTHTAEEEQEKTGNGSCQLTCDICGKDYKTEQRLLEHKKSHDNLKDLPCDFCDKKFQNSQDLAQHRRAHNKDKYVCPVCGVTFNSRSVYYFHKRTHPIDRPFLCHTCGKAFVTSSDLKLHKQRHSKPREKSQEGPFGCDVCGRVYQVKTSLKVHMKIHQGIFDHPCDFCDKKFKSPAELRHHRRVHTQERPYKCDTCHRTFSRHSTLVNHRRTHSGDRPYLCIVCGLAFKLANTLKKHSQVHNEEGAPKRRKARTKRPASEPTFFKLLPDVHSPGFIIDQPQAIETPILPTYTVTAAAPPVSDQQQLQQQQLYHQTQQHVLPVSHQPQQQALHQIFINPPIDASSALLLTPGLKQIQALIQANSSAFLHQFQPQQLQYQQDLAGLTNVDSITLPGNILHLQNTNSDTLMQLRDAADMTEARSLLTSDDIGLHDDLHNDFQSLNETEPKDPSTDLIDMRPVDVSDGVSDSTLQLNSEENFPNFYYFP